MAGAIEDVRYVQGAPLSAETSRDQFATVEDVLEGDLLKLSNGETVRLAGVVVHGSATVAYTRQLAAGKLVRVEYAAQPKDESGRLLAYVFVVTDKPGQAKVNQPDDYVIMTSGDLQEIFLNATLLRVGYARLTDTPSDAKYRDLFEKLQTGAQEGRRGVWGNEKPGADKVS